MPLQARIDAPGALHHVIIRGIEKRKTFRSDKELGRYIHCNSGGFGYMGSHAEKRA